MAAHPAGLLPGLAVWLGKFLWRRSQTRVVFVGRMPDRLREAGVTLHLAKVKGPVMDRLRRSELIAHPAPGRVFRSAEQAVQALTGAKRS